jgi:4-amino-4-deoxy-L-arabinose transferase-like glycosyltransferase
VIGPEQAVPGELDDSSRLRHGPLVGVALLAVATVAAWADVRYGWIGPAFDAVAHQFYEVPVLAKIRRPTQVPLVRIHLAILVGLNALGLLLSPRLDRHGRRWWAIFVAYAIRATAWIAGGNLPLVSGDSPHYVEIAASILRGEGPVKHYVESFFIDYSAIRQGKGVLDDWATPLYAYALAGAYRLAGVVPGDSLEATVAVDKALSFIFNLLCLPCLYFFARRRFGREIGLGALALLAILPVHAIYAGFDLRESLVALTSILAVWFLTEVWASQGASAWLWAIVAGLAGGAAVLSRDTAMATLAAAGLYGLVVHRRKLAPMIVWGLVVVAVIAPWAWVTYGTYGEPFYTYTKFFQYRFSWTVHHYADGVPKAADFYTWANAPEIARVKIKSLMIIVGYSSMILSVPLVLAFARRLIRSTRGDIDRLVACIGFVFVAATLARIADVTQVSQLGRYYLPLFVLMLPTAAAGLADWSRDRNLPAKARPALAATLVALLWADPTWAYDASWFTKPYQLHWPALRASGDWIKAHPDVVPPDARIMAWFPWEVRLATGRTTVLMPRNFDPKRIEDVIAQYGVTHVLWGSFETPANADPESFGPFLTYIRTSLRLTESREVYRSPGDLPFGVKLYRVRGGSP